ncbi:head fiber protein [Polaribacter sp. IC073]|uniref:head fiber protein n=1 Tax=Polaribacter sp. IC073 TaxID=2508540 RepID=UPI0011BE10C6|nr:head fiber protein [Polaribacter sp. IC073]TXD47344.1 hypothetical protein ES045_12160 [Polaribacter sp. IC073]
MPAGIKYDLKGFDVERELCNQKTIYRLAGGSNLVDNDVQNGTFIPHLAPLALDKATNTVKVVKSVKAYADISATALKISKGSLVSVGQHIGTGSKGGTISAIDKSNEAYDELTLAATITGVKEGDVLFEATAAGGTTQKNVAGFLNYARVKVEAGATVTLVGQAFEIQEDKLYLAISDKDKTSLGARFMFV